MAGSSVQVPLITGVGFGVLDGKVVSVGIGVFIIGVAVLMAVWVGGIGFVFVQEA